MKRRRRWIWALALTAAVTAGCVKAEKTPERRSTQTEESEKSQKAMEALAVPEDLELEEDEYGLLELTAKVRIPDYSWYFSENWEEAAAGAKDEKEFEVRLFQMAEETVSGGDVQWEEREITVSLSLADEARKAEDWSQEELEELARQEAFQKELGEFALSLMGDWMSEETDWETLLKADEEGE